MKTTTTLTLPLLLVASLLAIAPANAQEKFEASVFALDGTWILKQQVIVNGDDAYTSPLSGRTLRITEDGNFTEDYTSESHSDPELNAKITVAGLNTGVWRIEKTESESGEVAYRLLVRNETPADQAPRVFYEDEIRKAGPSLPLGFGRTESFEDGRWAVCELLLEVDADGETTGFEISNGTRSRIVWSFGKEGTLADEPVLLSQAATK